MKHYPIETEIADPTAMWARPDTGDRPASIPPAPTVSDIGNVFQPVLDCE